jgi:hypothetical protein
MARIDSRSHNSNSVDRALLRAGADTWHALVATAVALICVAPAVLIGALLLIEAVFSNAQPKLVQRSFTQPEAPRWRSGATPQLQFTAACTLLEPVRCVRD